MSEDETAFGNLDKTNAVPLLRLYFPREIAQLRDAYQQNVKIQSSAGGAKTAPQTGLTLSLSVTGNDDDSVAAYSPLQTPLSQESILQAIVTALRKQHAKVVLIRATDPLDMIFLCRYLRRNYPQARLVTTGADLLMAHDSYDPRFHRILAVTTYPILTGAHFRGFGLPPGGDKREEPQRLFPDSYSVGDFNALQSLLANETGAGPQKLPAAGYEQFGLPSFLDKEPDLDKDPDPWRAHLWLTAIGRDGYWPVSVLDDVPTKKLEKIWKEINRTESISPTGSSIPVPAPPQLPYTLNLPCPYTVHFPVSWTIFWLFTTALTVFVSFLLASPGASWRSEILARFGSSHSPARNGLLFTGSLLLLLTQTLFVFPVVIWITRFGHSSDNLKGCPSGNEVFNGMTLVMFCYFGSAAWSPC